MDFLEELNAMVKEACLLHPNSVEEPRRWLNEQFWDREDAEEFVTENRRAIMDYVFHEHVCRRRCVVNVACKSETTNYTERCMPKVDPASNGILKVNEMQSIWHLSIGGTVLHKLRVGDLPDLEELERLRAKGHIENADLLAMLREKTKGADLDKRVEQVLKQSVVEKAYRQMRKRLVEEFVLAGD